MPYTHLHTRAHSIYFDAALEDRLPYLWAILDTAAENWQAQEYQGTLEDYLREYGCPEDHILSKKVFLHSDYHDANWAIDHLTEEDLTLWAEEHKLDAHTLLALKEDI